MNEILIVGSGALAAYFGARLAASGKSIVMLGTWKEGIQALSEDGICLITDGDEKNFRVTATTEIKSIKSTTQALVLVKSWQTERAADQLAQILDPNGIALTLQNGLGNLEILRDKLGEERTALGVTTTGATLLGPGRVKAGGEGVITLEAHPKLTEIKRALEDAGLELEETGDLEGILWSKLIVNAAINPLTGLLGVPNGFLLNSKTTREIMRTLAEEAAAVAKAKGINLSYQHPAQIVEDVAASTAKNISSTLQDLRRGAPTEIDQINGAIVKEGIELGIPTPNNQIIWKLIKAKVEVMMERDDYGQDTE
jgi:2-dehydropantoate 2-reductase